MADLNERAARATDRQAFASFLVGLADSLLESPEEWENQDLERFLRAWSAWLEDVGAYHEAKGSTLPEEPSWAQIAQMVLAARVYE